MDIMFCDVEFYYTCSGFPMRTVITIILLLLLFFSRFGEPIIIRDLLKTYIIPFRK